VPSLTTIHVVAQESLRQFDLIASSHLNPSASVSPVSDVATTSASLRLSLAGCCLAVGRPSLAMDCLETALQVVDSTNGDLQTPGRFSDPGEAFHDQSEELLYAPGMSTDAGQPSDPDIQTLKRDILSLLAGAIAQDHA